jgi:hypothetical protein
MMRSFREFLIEDIKDIPDEVIQQVLGLLTPEELASLDSPSPETNKKIFRRLAAELHPDKTGRPAGDVENAALRIFGKQEASNAKTFDRVKSLRQTSPPPSGGVNTPPPSSGVNAPPPSGGVNTPPPSGGVNAPPPPPPPPPPIGDTVSTTAAAGGDDNAVQRFGRKAVDAAKRYGRKAIDTVVDTAKNAPLNLVNTVMNPGQIAIGAGKEAIAVGKDLLQGGFGLGPQEKPTSAFGKTLPYGAGLDLGINVGMDMYDISKDPQWQYKPADWWDVTKNVGKNIGYSTAIGAGIGTVVGGPAGTGAGAVAGALEGIATAPYQFAQNAMKMGYEERQDLANLKNILQTYKDTLKNNPGGGPEYENYYKESIKKLESRIAEMEMNPSGMSILSTAIDDVVSPLGNALFDRGQIKSGDELRSEAEAAFNARYPQGIPGGLAPGKSPEQIEKEAADMINARIAAGASPEELSKEFGWENPEKEKEEEKNRQERIEKENELMASDPEKYGKMGETELSAAAAAKVVTDKALAAKDSVQASRERTAQQDAEYQAKLAAVEDAIAKKQAEKDAVTAYERQQQKDARAINTGLSQEKYRKTMQDIEDKKALLAAGEKRKEEEKAKEAEERKAKLAKRKKEFDAKMAELDKTIAGGNVVLAQQYPQDIRRSKYGHLVSDGQGWGS